MWPCLLQRFKREMQSLHLDTTWTVFGLALHGGGFLGEIGEAQPASRGNRMDGCQSIDGIHRSSHSR